MARRRAVMPEPESYIRHLHQNAAGTDYVVGDLHGCMEDLFQQLSEVDFNPQVDRLFSVGDLIDRGPDSVGAIGLLDHPWFYAVRGNHEDMMIRAILAGEEMTELLWMRNGGDWAEHIDRTQLRTWAEKLAQLPYAIATGKEEDRINIIHAEFFGSDIDLDNSDWNDEVKSQLLWGRSLIQGKGSKECQQGLSKTYSGHTIVPDVTYRERQVFIDTGAYLKRTGEDDAGRLSLLKAGV